MKAIKTLEASKALIAACKADAKTSDTIAGLVRKLHAEASKAGHEEKAITEFVKETMAELYGEQTALFHIRWNAARQALFAARKKAGNSPKATPYKLPAKLKSAVLDTLKRNNLIDKAEQRKALLAIVKAL
jgi:ketol-acid reductoisomerase